jgi:hypothetical protein
MPDYVALQSIQHAGVYAYHPGDSVSGDNVERHGYEVGAQVAQVGSLQARDLQAKLAGLAPGQQPDLGPGFDPVRHSVPEVNDHLAAADDVERRRVLDAERATQHRRGILEGPHAGTGPEFDPGDHTVDEVNAHLDGADDEEKARVLVAERGGQQRRGIIEGRHAKAIPVPDVAEV